MPSHNHQSSKPKSSSKPKKSTRSSTNKKHSTPTTSHKKDVLSVRGSNSSAHHQHAENSTNSYVNSNEDTSSDPSVQQWLTEYSESAASRNYQYGVTYQAVQFQQKNGELSPDEFGPLPQEDTWFVGYGDVVQDLEGNFAGIGAQFES